jgi:hypothetical protein
MTAEGEKNMRGGNDCRRGEEKCEAEMTAEGEKQNARRK